jgi:hypothetical protein
MCMKHGGSNVQGLAGGTDSADSLAFPFTSMLVHNPLFKIDLSSTVHFLSQRASFSNVGFGSFDAVP